MRKGKLATVEKPVAELTDEEVEAEFNEKIGKMDAHEVARPKPRPALTTIPSGMSEAPKRPQSLRQDL